MLEKRNFNASSIRLENEVWAKLDTRAKQAGTSWKIYVQNLLTSKPSGRTTASWLRCAML
jgi:predicted DNA-binding ribbon-helix-helix protein